MGELDGKVAIVTGGASGIGAAAVAALLGQGASVVIADIDDARGEALAQRLGPKTRYARLDVSDEAAWRRVVADTVARDGRLDVLVNNAGIGAFADVEQETREGWDRVIAVNETSIWLGMKHAAPEMRRSGGGSVVNVSSIFGEVGGFGASVAYHAAKGSIGVMSRNAALRYAKEGIRVNSLHPGFVDTPLVAPVKGTPVEEQILSRTPMGRWGRPEEIGEVIAFMSGPRASFMTGSEVYVDGGWTAA